MANKHEKAFVAKEMPKNISKTGDDFSDDWLWLWPSFRVIFPCSPVGDHDDVAQ